MWLERSRTICWVGSSGTKLALIIPCAIKSASHVASFTSVLRPGTFFTCAAFHPSDEGLSLGTPALARINANSPSERICQTGFQ